MRRVTPDIGAQLQKIYDLEKKLDGCTVNVDDNAKRINGCLLGKKDVRFADKDTGDCIAIVMMHDKQRHWFHLHHPVHSSPCFRYDAAGHVHMNPHSISRTLAKRTVPSPHFHKFTKDGLEYAYRTAVIDKEEAALNDPSFAFHAFCSEGKVSADDGNPALAFKPTLFPEDADDPLEGHRFS